MKRFGIALVITLIALVVVIVLAFGLNNLGVQHLNHAHARLQSQKALYAAQAGTVEALRLLKEDSSWAGEGLETEQPLTLGPETYRVEVVNNFTGSTSLQASNGAAVPPGTTYILSTGAAERGHYERLLGTLVRLRDGANPWRYGLFGYRGLNIGNGDVDSYDSSEGSYLETRTEEGGNVGTNSIIGGTVLIGPEGHVYDVDVGPEGDPVLVINGANYHAAQPLDLPYPYLIDLVEPPDPPNDDDRTIRRSGPLEPGVYGDVSIGGSARVTLSEGTYVFDSLSVAGSASLVVTDTVQIYVAHNVSIAGNSLVNETGRPSAAIFLVGPEATTVDINGGPNVACAILAPTCTVTVNGAAGAFFGSVVADYVRMNGNAEFHYDRSLAGGGGGGTPQLQVVSRQRL